MTVANEEQLAILKQGVAEWNKWREENPEEEIDLSGADLSKANLWNAKLMGVDLSKADLNLADLSGAILSNADLSRADLSGAFLSKADFFEADLSGANLSKADLNMTKLFGANLIDAYLSEANLIEANLSLADLRGANLSRASLAGADLSGASLAGADLSLAKLSRADLSEADLREADLRGANLIEADLRGADLSGAELFKADLSEADLSEADLNHATLVETNLTSATLTGCKIYGISAWNLKLEGAEQSNLVITPDDEPTVMVDDLEVAQFIYLLLNNTKIRDVLDTIGKKGVLILGRFTPARKQVLDALREKLRELGYVPMMFDFEGATTKDFTETVKILAGMSRFIIADITNPKSSPLELQATVPDYMVPFVPIIQESEEPFSMFADLQNKYDWVMDVLEYEDHKQLISVAEKAIIRPALKLENELIPRKTEEIRKRHAKDYQ